MNKGFSFKMKDPLTENLICSNDLERYFMENTDRVVHKWWHYFAIYERHFSKFRGKSPVILEVGVSKGGSLQMWKDYFGPGCRIYGIDIDPSCKKYEEDDIEIFIGSQEDPIFLAEVRDRIGKVDIMIDDGGHEMSQQITTFRELYGSVSTERGGVYLCEDTHTSYHESYFNAGLGNPNSFMEMAKSMVDRLHVWHSEQLNSDDFSESTSSMHFYDSIVVFEKSPMSMPWHGKTGTITQ